ncbi:hypothetical protein SAMN02745824_2028 [Parasphingorhabdus marina DSM 22363]|uniref:5-bromo-4-chloroindolyl phosphate hydrolysis protein n=1 Tax=Parasphingorhabdus marina DSM 22363 TaxID=1123272 RepID=A0A1N6EPQ2_9SPHN|nr:hypothetical protein [Parasphingorhabdus marina]SIN84978.1 hypothetical protein SAMN02745824_2028 [Parasphingorhabdus marina DSM 22363]
MAIGETSDQIMASANRALKDSQFRRSIGHKSHQMKRGHFFKKLGRAALITAGVLVGASIVGGILNGIGFWGVMISAGLIAGGIWAAMKFPKMKIPTPESLVQSDLKSLAGKTEIWLEAQRPALPKPAIKIVNNIGTQLDMLSPQLQKLNEGDAAAYEIRKLMGEHLPELISGYRAIPESMRNQDNDHGKTPDEQLIGGLSLIEKEIAGVTQQIAKGDIDNLSIRGRYLELKYDKSAEAET